MLLILSQAEAAACKPNTSRLSLLEQAKQTPGVQIILRGDTAEEGKAVWHTAIELDLTGVDRFVVFQPDADTWLLDRITDLPKEV